MRVQSFTNYSKLYEAKLMECQFLTEQNITAEDIINPLESLITEEFIGKFIQKGKQAVSNVYSNVKDAISKFFTGVVNFFKNFSLSKLAGSILSKIKEIGTKTWTKIKDMLSGFKDFIVSNGLCDENNRPNFQRIWQILCQKAKSAVNWQEAGVTPDKLQSVGNQVKLNEADSPYAIGDDEVKYYGVFEKIALALGIKNARFNGVVSQIMKKTTIGLIIIGILKVAGISLAGLTLGLSPVAMAAIGGMLLMAGLIILAIWVCKPYPTVEDCLAYLHMAFGGNLKGNGVTNIFIQDIDITYVENTDVTIVSSDSGEKVGDQISISAEETKNTKPLKSLYPTMVKNLQALQSMIISFEGVKLASQSSSTRDDIRKKNAEELSRVQRQKVRESILPYSIFEKEFSKQPRNVEITAEEDYLTQAFKNTQKSLKVLKDEKDKGIGITDKFIKNILDKKMDVEAKKSIKALYEEVYEHLYGKYSKTMSDLGALYKESVEIISDKNKRKVVAEKIARLAKRTLQFEGENMYGSLGEFGADMRDFNTTLKEIMASFKAEVKESKIYSFENYNNK